METGVAQDHHAFFKLSNEPLKGLIRDIGGGTHPRHHQAVLIQPQPKFTAANPAMIGEACAAALVGTATFEAVSVQ
jgi:hypothetical protein